MTETERNQIKGALLKCAEENENKFTLTGHIIVKGAHTTVCGVPEENRTVHVLKLNEEAEQLFKE